MSEEISDKERGVFNDLIILVLLIFSYFVYYMLNTNGFRHNLKPTEISLISTVLLTFVFTSFLMTPSIKKVIYWLSFGLGLILLFGYDLELSLGMLTFILLYGVFYFFLKSDKTEYIILILLIAISFLFTELIVLEPRMNSGVKLTGVFVNFLILLVLSKFLSKKNRPIIWGVGLVILILLFMKVKFII